MLSEEFKTALKQSETLLLLCIDISQLHQWDSLNHPNVVQFKNQFLELRTQSLNLEQKLSVAENQFQLPAEELKSLEDILVIIQRNIQEMVDIIADTPIAISSPKLLTQQNQSIGAEAGLEAINKKPFPIVREPSSVPENESNPLSVIESKVLLQGQQLLFQGHDLRLDQLAQSVQRQKGMAIDMGEELDTQVVLLEEMDMHVDRTELGLSTANSRLALVSRKLKDTSPWWWILGLLFLLLFLLYI